MSSGEPACPLILPVQKTETTSQPDPVVLVTPIGATYVSDRTIYPSNIPVQRDNQVLGTMGFKFSSASGMTIVTNAIIPMLRGGLQPNIAFTLGLEYTF